MSKKIGSDLKLAFNTIEKNFSTTSKDEAKATFRTLKDANVDPRVMHNLAFCYSEGFGTKRDYKKAFRLYKLSAKAGSLGAFFNIAHMYEKGQGVKKNQKKAFEYYKKGAEIGDVWSHLNVGWHYYNGVGTPMDLELAEFHWKAAAKKRIPSAIYSLGILYRSKGVSRKNLERALKQFEKAYELGHKKSGSEKIKTIKMLKRLD